MKPPLPLAHDRFFSPFASSSARFPPPERGRGVYSASRVPWTPVVERPYLLPKERIDAAVSTELEQIWSRVQSGLEAAVDDSTYRLWLAPLRAHEVAHGTLTVEAPVRSCAWVRERFGRLLQTCAATVLGPEITVDVIHRHPDPRPGRPAAPQPHAPRPAGARPSGRLGNTDPTRAGRALPSPDPIGNPRLSFEHFVIGDSNRLAHAAALTVAELPGQAYNPLFICGSPGVGKTHLLRSIACLLQSSSPGLSIRTSTGESFTNEFQLALTSGGMDLFKSRFRDVDVLLIDDVQFLERKTRTEEEFFHTFNTLHEAGAQLVLTSDRPPRDLQALEDRLRERFQAGLVADIHPPDTNTRLAILRKRAHHDGIDDLQPGTLEVIARRIALDVRALEGALIRVVAFSSLTGRPLAPALAAEVLDGLYPHTRAQTRTLAEIQAAACRHFDISPEELLSPSRTARVAWPRQVAMYLARELTDESLPTIGRHFGGRDHTTVIHAVRRAEQKIVSDAASRTAVDNLRYALESHDS
jgi:chromosomal replication initiator protein